MRITPLPLARATTNTAENFYLFIVTEMISSLV
jgi:hypothetical protein